MTYHNELPEPVCKLGYPVAQLEEILGDRMPTFWHWMRGQTMSVCDGREYDYNTREHHPTGCGPHGSCVYPWDLRQFLAGGKALD